jgi:hypothetical protein
MNTVIASTPVQGFKTDSVAFKPTKKPAQVASDTLPQTTPVIAPAPVVERVPEDPLGKSLKRLKLSDEDIIRFKELL